MKKLYTLIIVALILLPLEVSGQGYYRQAGVRTGVRGGIFIQLPAIMPLITMQCLDSIITACS